ncbi:MAG TPA: hypothetical protein VFQ53_33050 [Kofleriaceae bacterium]|nr:hypothetical protein [Kofleriaceae bacterium]
MKRCIVDVAGPATERVIRRLCLDLDLGFEAKPELPLPYQVTFLETDGEQRTIGVGVTRDGDAVRIATDGPWPDIDVEVAREFASFMRGVAMRLDHEAVRFDSFEDIGAYLERDERARYDAAEEVVYFHPISSVETVRVYPVQVAGEPWIAFSITLAEDDQVDPSWALLQNARSSCGSLAWVDVADRYDLEHTYPLMELTGQRLYELLETLATKRESLLADLDDGDDVVASSRSRTTGDGDDDADGAGVGDGADEDRDELLKN